MLTIIDRINREIDRTLNCKWQTVNLNSNQFPSDKYIPLGGGAVKMNATYLYADLANSTKLAQTLDRRIVAKVFKSYLATSCRLIRRNNGKVLGYDGDRILGIFVGRNSKNNAVKCAFEVNYVTKKIIRLKFKEKFKGIRDNRIKINHGIGIDSGEVLIIRAGARRSNDLVSIGRGPNLAAKLSDIRLYRPEASIFITRSVFNSLSLYNREDIWRQHKLKIIGKNITVYKTNETRIPK